MFAALNNSRGRSIKLSVRRLLGTNRGATKIVGDKKVKNSFVVTSPSFIVAADRMI